MAKEIFEETNTTTTATAIELAAPALTDDEKQEACDQITSACRSIHAETIAAHPGIGLARMATIFQSLSDGCRAKAFQAALEESDDSLIEDEAGDLVIKLLRDRSAQQFSLLEMMDMPAFPGWFDTFESELKEGVPDLDMRTATPVEIMCATDLIASRVINKLSGIIGTAPLAFVGQMIADTSLAAVAQGGRADLARVEAIIDSQRVAFRTAVAQDPSCEIKVTPRSWQADLIVGLMGALRAP